jgi:hypothetical protein
MASHAPPTRNSPPTGWFLAPLHIASDATPLRICLLVRESSTGAAGRFALLREVPGYRVYLGVVCDTQARVQEWVEIAVQSLDLRDLAFSGYQERLTNFVFDQRWATEFESVLAQMPHAVLVTGMEQTQPEPLLILKRSATAETAFSPVEPAGWQVCREDALLQKHGLQPYSTSPFRYLHQPAGPEPKVFLATSADAPRGANVQSIDRLTAPPEVLDVFNPHAGLVRVTRFSPLELEDFLQILEGRPWGGLGPGTAGLAPSGVYEALREWSANQKGMPFLLNGAGDAADRLNEILCLKLATLAGLIREVRGAVKASQSPLLNISPSSFRIEIPPVGGQFPALWSSRGLLVKPGQAHPLKIKATEQRYFIRLGKSEPSVYLPEGLGAHSFGIGSVRRRSVVSESGSVTLEGTLVAEDYLRLDTNDLLWFKLPVGEERVEFYAHVQACEAVGPKEARFRTVPAQLPEPVVAALQATAAFAKAPYEIWPLLSSPCDLHSLGILAIRTLFANSRSQLPAIIDDILGLARRVGKEVDANDKLFPRLKTILEAEPKLLDTVSPQNLVEREWSPQAARAQIHISIWLESVAWVLRLFPGTGAHSYCSSFGDVSPLALETVFDRPIADLERLTLRLRSVLLPTLHTNQEIASVLLEQLSREGSTS